MVRMTRMVAYVGWWRDTAVWVWVEDMGGGAGKVRCFECRGAGVIEEPDGSKWPCSDCKGAGYVYTSI